MRGLLIAVLVSAVLASDTFDLPDECTGVSLDTTNNACLVFGENHIFTFDGQYYHPQTPGDFILMKDYNGGTKLEVQARYEGYQCLAAFGCARLTGLAIRGKNTPIIAFYYDADSDALATTLDGENQIGGVIDLNYAELTVLRRNPEGFYISFTNYGTIVRARFSPVGVAVWIFADDSQANNVAGACGTYDGCAYNDIVVKNTGDRFDPVDAFASWAVFGSDSLFESPKSGLSAARFSPRAPFVSHKWTPYSPTSSAIPSAAVDVKKNAYLVGMAVCNHFVAGAVYNACQYEMNLFGSHSRLWLGLTAICSELCDNDVDTIASFKYILHNCSTICDLQMKSSEQTSNFNFHDLGEIDMSEYVLQNEERAFFMPPAGGDYVFSVTGNDCCSTAQTSVTVSVQCETGFKIMAMEDVVIDLDEYWFPEVQLLATLVGVDLYDYNMHVSWELISCPDAVICSEFTIYNAYSLAPFFIPTAVGNYTFEVVATDGCAYAKDTVLITVNCFMRTWIWNEDADEEPTADTCRWSGVATHFDALKITGTASCYTQVPMEGLGLTSTLTWEGDDIYTLVQQDSDTYNLVWTIDDETSSVSVETYNETELIDTWEDSADLNIASLYVYPINRVEILYSVDQYRTVIYTDTITRRDVYSITSYECVLELDPTTDDSSGVTFSLTATPASTSKVVTPSTLPEWVNTSYPEYAALAEKNRYFVIGNCQGSYALSLSAIDNLACASADTEFPFDVNCDNEPHTNMLSPCFDVYFDYDIGKFPSIYIEGRDADARRNRTVSYKWYMDNGTSPISTSRAFYWGTKAASYQGTHTLAMRISDGCTRNEESKTFSMLCLGSVTIVISLDKGYTALLPYNYTRYWNTYYLWRYTYNTSKTSVSTTLYPDLQLTDQGWKIDKSGAYYSNPQAYVVQFITGYNYYFTSNTQKTTWWTATLTLTDGCDTETTTVVFGVNCTAVLTVKANYYDKKLYYDPFSSSWPTMTLTDNSTSFDGATDVGIATNKYYWRITYANATVSTCSTSSCSVNFNKGAGTYKIQHTAGDYCMRSTVSLSDVTVECQTNVITPSLTGDKYSLYFEDGTYSSSNAKTFVQLNATLSTCGVVGANTVPLNTGRVYWTVADSSKNVYCNTYTSTSCSFLDFYVFGYYDVLVPAFHVPSTIIDPTTFIVILTVSDGCKNSSMSYTISIDCSRIAVATASIDKTTVTHTNGMFPLVCVNGASSTIWSWTPSELTYQWHFVKTPAGSLFKTPDQYVTVSLVDALYTFENGPYTAADDHEYYLGYSEQMYQYTYNSYNTYLVNLEESYLLNFGACFHPDIAGTYSLELLLSGPGSYSCHVADASASVSVVASCSATLAPSIAGPSSANPGDLVTFKASCNKGSSPLSYEWTVTSGGTDYTYLLINAHAATLSLHIPTILDTFTFTLTATDNCSTASTSKTLTVSCPEAPDNLQPTVEGANYTFSGIGTAPIVLEVQAVSSNITNETSTAPVVPLQYEWTVVSYTPFQANEPIVSSASAISVAFVFVFVCVFNLLW